METSATKRWLEFPLSVFVDTQVFIKESYNFSTKGKFALLKKQIDSGKVQLLISDIVKGEVERHIREDVGKGLEKLQSALNDRNLAIFREGKHSGIFQTIDSALMTNDALETFYEYLRNAKANWLDIADVHLKSVIDDYFSSKPPFGKGNKKSEFPDAFNASLLKKYSITNGTVYVVSNDGDFSNVENLHCFKTLNELLDAIISHESNIIQQSKVYLNSLPAQKAIFDKVESTLMDVGDELFVDGTDTDRKGVSSGYEYDETELVSISTHNVTDFEVVDAEYTDKTITIMTNCISKLEFLCSFFDEDNSVWDSVDKEYIKAYYGKVREAHNALIPVTINITYENDGDGVSFEIDEIVVDTNLKFDQYTLQKDGRNRTDNPYRYWAEDAVKFENYCPDCGCGMTFENDGGNGFCTNCASEH